jgi:hypothetical protein
MVARYLNKKGQTRRYCPDEISAIASEPLTTGPARQGLVDLQIMHALRTMGLNPVHFAKVGDPKLAKEFIFSSIESELPVVVLLLLLAPEPILLLAPEPTIPDLLEVRGAHVVVAIGHDLQESVNFSTPPYSLDSAVDSFIVHDDMSGPYQETRIGERRDIPLRGRSPVPGPFLTFAQDAVLSLIVPLPHRVNMHFEDARFCAILWLNVINWYAANRLESPGLTIWPPASLENLVTRIYLRRSSDFKHDLLNSPIGGYLRNPQIIARYRCMEMPKYIWVIELADCTDMQNKPLSERKIRGEILLDSTGNRNVPEETLLGFHLNGILFIPGRNEKSSTLVTAPEDEDLAYSPLQRVTPRH